MTELSTEERARGTMPGSFSYHEAMDRAGLLADTVDVQLCQHSVIQENETLRELAENARKSLASLYNTIAEKHFDAA